MYNQKLKVLFTILIGILSSNTINSQRIGWSEIDESKVSPWNVENIKDYESVYHFGESEGESDFILIVVDSTVYGQIRTGHWNENSTGWIPEHINLQNIRIEGSKFFSDSYNGEFVVYDNGKEPISGLKIDKPWMDEPSYNGYEIGTVNYPINIHYELGNYTQASTQLLKLEDLKKYTSSELQLMRNEIYARYGYIFSKGEKMDTYFSKTKWYKPQYKSVENMLTELEKQNIKTIKKNESK